MSKAFLVFMALVFSVPSLAAKQAGAPSQSKHEPNPLADLACLDAIGYLASHGYERSTPSAAALAHVRRCNGHPNKIACEITSQATMREYGKTPFTCGSDIADYTLPVIVPENPLLVMPDSLRPAK